MDDTKQLKDLINFDNTIISDYLQTDIENYVLRGFELSGFTYSVFNNDLHRTIQTADSFNYSNINKIVYWILENLPAQCYGSAHKIDSWMGDSYGIRTKYIEKLKEDKVWEILHD